MWRNELAYIAGGNAKWNGTTLENSLAVSYNIKHMQYLTSMDVAVLLLGVYLGITQEKCPKSWTQIFIAALFILVIPN